MKTAKIFLFLGCLVMLIFFMAHTATAGCAKRPDGESVVETNKNTRTKLSGPLTTYYNDEEGKLYYFVRLRKGVKLYIFAGSEPLSVDISSDPNAWISDAQPLIISWFDEIVIPDIYECREPPADCPFEDFALKSFEMDVITDDPGYVPLSIDGVSIMDIVIAVDD